jgi:hypothetical protein
MINTTWSQSSLDAIQAAIDELNLASFSNLSQWVAAIDRRVRTGDLALNRRHCSLYLTVVIVLIIGTTSLRKKVEDVLERRLADALAMWFEVFGVDDARTTSDHCSARWMIYSPTDGNNCLD